MERLRNQDELWQEAEPGCFPQVTATSNTTAHLCAYGKVPTQGKPCNVDDMQMQQPWLNKEVGFYQEEQVGFREPPVWFSIAEEEKDTWGRLSRWERGELEVWNLHFLARIKRQWGRHSLCQVEEVSTQPCNCKMENRQKSKL